MKSTQTAADSSPGVFALLPQETIEKILAWLPVKSLLKFRCVSRSWLSLISNPNFIRTHLENSLTDESYTHHRILSVTCSRTREYFSHCSLHSLLYNPVTELMNVSPASDRVVASSRGVVVGSCNGLVVCTDMGGNDLFLWNPSTRELRKLPDPEMPIGYLTYGFAFDESTKDYKIVNNLHTDSSSFIGMVKIYSLKTNSWKRIEDFPGIAVSKTCKVVNQKLHWAAFTDLNRFCIVSLDIRTEVFDEIELPFLDIQYTRSILAVLGGCLSVLMSYKSWWDLWILKEYGLSESWTKVANISYDNLKNNLLSIPLPRSASELMPLYMLNNGEILLLIEGNFVVYNLEDESLKQPVTTNFNGCFESVIYVESLVSPFGDGGVLVRYQ